MKERKAAREFLFKFIYQKIFDQSFDDGEFNLELEIKEFQKILNYPLKEEKYIKDVLASVIENRKEINEKIQANLVNWKLKRIAKIDRAIITLGFTEMKFISPPTPRQVIINECVELSKVFGPETSKSFVNGILDKLSND